MDGTTWGGFTSTDPSGHNWYGTQNVYGPQYDWNNPQYNATWSLDQSSVPSHSHSGANFQIELSSTKGGSYAPSGTLTLSGPMGSFVVPIDPSSPGYTPSYTQTTSQFTGSCANGYISISGPDTSTNAEYTLSCSEGWGVAVVTGSVSDGTNDGANSSSIPICVRAGQDTQQTFGLDSPATTSTDVFFETNNLPVDAPAGQEQWNTDYTVSGATLVSQSGYGDIYKVTIPGGSTQSGAVTFHAVCPYAGGPETSNKDVAISVISDPNPPSNVIAAQPVNAGPLFQIFGFKIAVLVISPDVQGELSDAQMDGYINNFADPDPNVRGQALTSLVAAIRTCPSQHVHDYLYNAWTQAQDPSVKNYLWQTFVQVGWTDDALCPPSDVGMQYVWSSGWFLSPVNVPPDKNNPRGQDQFWAQATGDSHVQMRFNVRDQNSQDSTVVSAPTGYGVPVYLCARQTGTAQCEINTLQQGSDGQGGWGGPGRNYSDNDQKTWFSVTQSLL